MRLIADVAYHFAMVESLSPHLHQQATNIALTLTAGRENNILRAVFLLRNTYNAVFVTYPHQKQVDGRSDSKKFLHVLLYIKMVVQEATFADVLKR